VYKVSVNYQREPSPAVSVLTAFPRLTRWTTRCNRGTISRSPHVSIQPSPARTAHGTQLAIRAAWQFA
jgi:hypothetical protein